MRLLSILALLQILFGCDESPTKSQVSQAVTFEFSKAAAMNDLNAETSWCNGKFDAVLINADPANINRRFFQMGEGVYSIAVQLSNATSSLFLKKTSEKKIEIFTSDNFPFCTSNRANFTLDADNASLGYDNKRYITYTVSVQSSSEGLFVVIDFPKEMTYGLTVHQCVGCR